MLVQCNFSLSEVLVVDRGSVIMTDGRDMVLEYQAGDEWGPMSRVFGCVWVSFTGNGFQTMYLSSFSSSILSLSSITNDISDPSATIPVAARPTRAPLKPSAAHAE